MQTRRPTIRVVAAAAKVSPMTVSLALRDHSSLPATTRLAIQKLAREMDYRPNPLVSTLMSQLRSTHSGNYVATLGLVTGYKPGEVGHLEIPAHRSIVGARQRAEQLGYILDEFRIKDPGMTSRALSKILIARGIYGLIIPGLRKSQGHLSLDWSRFSSCAMGYSMLRPDLHRVVNHQFQTIRIALRELKHRQYRRIGLALPADLDKRVDHNWLAGFLAFQHSQPRQCCVPPFIASAYSRQAFEKWFQKHSPDAVIAIDTQTLDWIRGLGRDVPNEVGFAHLDCSRLQADLAGVDQNPELVGAAAVDSVNAQLQRNERGIPDSPKITMIKGVWVDGKTVRHPGS